MQYIKNQNLFSNNYLENKINQSEIWEQTDLEANTAYKKVQEIYNNTKLSSIGTNNEAQLEDKFIRPILTVLGFEYDVQPISQRGSKKKRPDYALFLSKSDYKNAISDKQYGKKYYSYPIAIAEVKYWNRPLNDTVDEDKINPGDATAQTIRYLDDTFISSDGKILWAILTNGAIWRLFYYRSVSRSGNYYEINLASILDKNDFESFKYFYCFFSNQAFSKNTQTNKCWLDVYLEGSESYAKKVSDELKQLVFDEIFRWFAEGFMKYRQNEKNIQNETENGLKEIFSATMNMLYRVLFVLFAESRELLPVNDSARYGRMSFKKLKEDIANDIKTGVVISDNTYTYWNRLETIFRIIDKGDKNLNIPSYNGRLFKPLKGDFLTEHRIADKFLAQAINKLTTEKDSTATAPQFIDYSSLGVRQLGDIYEGLLEFHLCINKGELYIENSKHERKTSGSYYTPHFIVESIVKNVISPVLKEKFKLVSEKLKTLNKISDKLKKASKTNLKFLRNEKENIEKEIYDDLFSIKILDPAMGSGHFLVHTVDYITDSIVKFLAENQLNNPVIKNIRRLREEIVNGLKNQKVTIDPSKLTEINLIKRKIMKQCIYGIDLNPMAVELAKLSLWLDSFTLGAPLSFLDHHLKCGNSLIGAIEIQTHIGPGSTREQELKRILSQQVFISSLSDSTLDEVNQSSSIYQQISKDKEPFKRMLNVTVAGYFTEMPANKKEHLMNSVLDYARKANRAELKSTLGKKQDFFSDKSADDEYDTIAINSKTTKQWYDEMQQLAENYNFFHWQIEFPEVFYGTSGITKIQITEKQNPGFDAVIGNPPWERIKLQENEFFATLSTEIAYAPKASKRKKLIADLHNIDPELWEIYETTKTTSEKTNSYIKNSNKYPLMGKGDTNYYSVFCELGTNLINKTGYFGMVMPSGIATDKTSESFFQNIIDKKTLVSLYDYENKEAWFANVHRSFKFSIITICGDKLSTNKIECAFYLHNPEELNNTEKIIELTPNDFVMFNPNTKTCPVFRTKQDVEITRGIYSKIPILIKHGKKEANPWNIQFHAMFHMTNDSDLFMVAKELEDNGYYLTAGNIYAKGKEKYLPLYEGKMVQIYDHRAASVEINPANLFRPAKPRQSTEPEHKNPDYIPAPQFWVPEKEVIKRLPDPPPEWFISYKNVAAPTNIRTMIVSLLPLCGVGNSQPLILTNKIEPVKIVCLLANLSSFVLDFIARQKMGGQNLNFFIVEQFPVLPPDKYNKQLGEIKLENFIKERVLKLVYVSNDMNKFANDLEFKGNPFTWDEETRLHLCCQLDAMYFILYDVDIKSVSYIMDSFHIVKEKDITKFGRYRTKELIESYYKAYKSGDYNTTIKK
jgi:hypothetical protein